MKKVRLFTLLLFPILLNSCYVGRYFAWNFADIKDHKKFKSLPVQKGNEPFYFNRNPDVSKDFEVISYNGKKQNFENFLKESKTVAFLIIRNDSILFEKYFFGYSASSVVPSFSMSKSVVSALVGIAIQDGYIKSVHQPITDFIPEIKDRRCEKITLEHLLNMRSGIDYNEGYFNPFGNVAKAYYGRQLLKHIRNIKVKSPPDLQFEYLSINTQLLGIAVERATGKKLNEYLEEKIWKHLGMEYDASWSIDSKKNKMAKAFCCLNAMTHDYAKFGRLFLNNGNWNGKQIVPKDWVEQSTKINKNSKDFFYSYQWWHNVQYLKITDTSKIDTSGVFQYYTRVLNGKETRYVIKPSEDFMAVGLLGQYIYVNPEKKMIIVRLGKKRGKVAWQSVFKEIAR